MNTARCNIAAGTYVCSLAAGHAGLHESRSPIYSSENQHIGTRLARFEHKYAPVRFFTTTKRLPR